jgi:hypothetical protein
MTAVRSDCSRLFVTIENVFGLFGRVVGMREDEKISWFHVEEI